MQAPIPNAFSIFGVNTAITDVQELENRCRSIIATDREGDRGANFHEKDGEPSFMMIPQSVSGGAIGSAKRRPIPELGARLEDVGHQMAGTVQYRTTDHDSYEHKGHSDAACEAP